MIVSTGRNTPPALWLETDTNDFSWPRLAGAVALSLLFHLSLAGSAYYLLTHRPASQDDYVLAIELAAAQPPSTEPQPVSANAARAVQAKLPLKPPRTEPVKAAPPMKPAPVQPAARKAVTDKAVAEKPVPPADLPDTQADEQADEQVAMASPAPVDESRLARPARETSTRAALLEHIRPVYAPPPVYPKPARRLGLEGRVLLNVWVSATGVPDAIVVKQSSGYDSLDNSARNGVARWRFDVPDKQADTGGWVELPVTFRLE
ncbi:MAG TPA: energy transducer TonB [Thiotrichales bacterium]|nr:energy transducer TonB [Thiotrichales bacterium]